MIYTVMRFLSFFPTSEFKWIHPKNFDSNRYNNNSRTGSVLEVDFEYYIMSYIIIILLLQIKLKSKMTCSVKIN